MQLVKEKIIRIIIFAIIAFLIFPMNFAMGALQSQSYVIYESVMHNFDGPIISAVSHSVSEQSATVTWTTDQLSDAFVEYSTDSGFATSKEQGTSVQNATNHSVVVGGLEGATTYYYRVKSKRINGGITINTPVANSFTTEAVVEPTPVTPAPEPAVSSGGGILIIDKTDKIAPIISEVNLNVLNSTEVELSWKTDEVATEFAEYGMSLSYGSTFGKWSTSTEHTVKVSNLQEGVQYHIRALSSDSWGNVGYSEDILFSTLKGVITDEPGASTTPPTLPLDEAGIMAEVSRRVLEFLNRLFPQVSLNNLGNNLQDINSLDDLNNFAPTPILSGEPQIKVTATEATISWLTDIPATSQVAMSDENNYRANLPEAYQQIVGNAETMDTVHEVTLYNLAPNTTYHIQLRSKPAIGNVARSRDFTFVTAVEELTITSFFSQVIDDQTAEFKWITNKNSDSEITYAPYRDGILAVDLSKTVKDNTKAVIHNIKVSDFVGGTVYNVVFASTDDAGNRITETLTNFTTAPDDAPPIASHIKADSTVFLDRNNKTQTIISWLTNEPATSRIFYQEGVFGTNAELKESTELNSNYTKEHVVVITKFKPGIVYTFRVESTDSGGNVVLSKPHTFMTAKKKESIFQIIMNILENTFGWMKKIGN